MLDPENNGTVSPESLWRMTGGSQIGNCIKSVGTSNGQNGRPNRKICRMRVLKNDMGSVKCPFRRACAVEWFGQFSQLRSSVAWIWYMATDFGHYFKTFGCIFKLGHKAATSWGENTHYYHTLCGTPPLQPNLLVVCTKLATRMYELPNILSMSTASVSLYSQYR